MPTREMMEQQGAAVTEPIDAELVYVGDPMCSWCWGFVPCLHAMEARLPIPLRVVVGGLRPGPSAELVDDRMATFLEGCWTSVEAASGQPFDRAPLRRRGWKYDTELPCTAVVGVRSLAPAQALAFFERLQRAFYAEDVDVTDPGVYAGLVEGLVPDPAGFAAELAAGAWKEETWAEFAWARQMGVSGYPTVLLRSGETWQVVTRGFMPADKLIPGLERWIEAELGPIGQGESCSVDGSCP